MDWQTEEQIHSLRVGWRNLPTLCVGWRNFFSSCAVVSVFGYGGKGSTKCRPVEFVPIFIFGLSSFFFGTYLYVFLYTWAQGGVYFLWLRIFFGLCYEFTVLVRIPFFSFKKSYKFAVLVRIPFFFRKKLQVRGLSSCIFSFLFEKSYEFAVLVRIPFFCFEKK